MTLYTVEDALQLGKACLPDGRKIIAPQRTHAPAVYENRNRLDLTVNLDMLDRNAAVHRFYGESLDDCDDCDDCTAPELPCSESWYNCSDDDCGFFTAKPQFYRVSVQAYPRSLRYDRETGKFVMFFAPAEVDLIVHRDNVYISDHNYYSDESELVRLSKMLGAMSDKDTLALATRLFNQADASGVYPHALASRIIDLIGLDL